jgi:hypothetical protein
MCGHTPCQAKLLKAKNMGSEGGGDSAILEGGTDPALDAEFARLQPCTSFLLFCLLGSAHSAHSASNDVYSRANTHIDFRVRRTILLILFSFINRSMKSHRQIYMLSTLKAPKFDVSNHLGHWFHTMSNKGNWDIGVPQRSQVSNHSI